MTFEELVGARLIFGIPGTTLTPEIVRHFQETHAGGLMLYRINFESPEQLRKLISDLEAALGRRLLVCTDHEGGRVIMFGEGVTIFPSNQALGQVGNTQHARHQGEQEGRELRRLGIDVNFAPVLDVLTDAFSPNIGIRSYGKDPDLVAKMGAARIAAMQVEGLSACAKHFPGLGPATLDPHLKLPQIATTWEEMDKIHLVPFLRAMRTAVHSIMTSHAVYPHLDSTRNLPATFSRALIQDYLRMKTGYKGVIFSDDLEMGAVRELCPIGEAAVQAAKAGHDMFLSCHDMNSQKAVCAELVEAYRSKKLPTKELEESVQRVEILKGKRTERFTAPPATAARAQREWDEAQTLVRNICDQSSVYLRPGVPPASSGATAVIFPKLSSLAGRIMIEKELLDENTFLKNRFQALGASCQPIVTAIEPNEEEITAAAKAAASADQTVLFLYDAHLYPSNKKLLETVQGSAKKLAVVLLRDVYDAEFVKPDIPCLTDYGFRVCEIDAVLRKLLTKSAVSAH